MKNLIFTLFLTFLLSGIFAQPSQQSLKWQNRTRKFIVYTPPSYVQGDKLPLIIDMHPFLGSAAGEMGLTKYNRLADTANCIIVYPNGVGGRWNTGATFGISSNVDDVGFIARLIDYMSLLYNVDATKVYATGYSAGGFMSYKLACELTNRIAAIAPVAASMHPDFFETCEPARAVPIKAFNSVNDPVTRYNGFEGVTPVDDVLALWGELNFCDEGTTETPVPNVVQNDGSTVEEVTYENCDAPYILMRMFGAGHTWPGAQPFAILGNTNQDINATKMGWEFFKQFTIPEELVCDAPTNLSSTSSEGEVTLTWDAVDGIDFYSVLVIYPNETLEYLEDIADNEVTLSISESGNIIYAVRSQCESGHVDWSEIKVDQASLRIANTEGGKVELFPNPTQDVVNIKTNQPIVNKNYQILNNFGMIVKRGVLSNQNTEVNVSNLLRGVYYVKFDGETEQYLLVKQ